MAIWSSFRTPFTTQQAYGRGLSHSKLKWEVRVGRIHRLAYGLYVAGPEKPNAIEYAFAPVVAGHRTARGALAAVLHGFDIPELRGRLTRPRACEAVDSPYETLIQLAKVLDDPEWEQALESALRKKLVKVEEFRGSNNLRIRRVLKLRPVGAPPTESLLETYAVQLIRRDQALPTPTRQLEIGRDRVDLAYPGHGVFLELDGQQHKDQPVYDATRQTRIVAATGWLVGRFTWDDIVRRPNVTLRQLRSLLSRAAIKNGAK